MTKLTTEEKVIVSNDQSWSSDTVHVTTGLNTRVVRGAVWVFEIGFVLHKIVCRRGETHRQGAVAGRFLGVTAVGEDLGFGSHGEVLRIY